jgi:heme-degrading monooxygenase HmoA
MLRPELERIEGFLENTRYRSRTRDGVLLSLSLWHDEKAVIRWRSHPGHFAAQERGRREILADYRLRVGEVIALLDAGKPVTLPAHSCDTPEVGEAKAIGFVLDHGVGGPRLPPGTAGDAFDGLIDAADTAEMGCYASLEQAEMSLRSVKAPGRSLVVRVIRDYGLIDRREAPQFHPPAHSEPALKSIAR